jgi:hypothetical protein
LHVGDHPRDYVLPVATLRVLNNLARALQATCRKDLTPVGNTTDISVSLF